MLSPSFFFSSQLCICPSIKKELSNFLHYNEAAQGHTAHGPNTLMREVWTKTWGTTFIQTKQVLSLVCCHSLTGLMITRNYIKSIIINSESPWELIHGRCPRRSEKRRARTTTEHNISPGWQLSFIPVLQPGSRIRDKCAQLFCPSWYSPGPM